MTNRPTLITILALYLLIVSGISIAGSLVGAARELPPYTSTQWLVLVIPKLLAFAAGIALWRMLKVGAWLWFASILIGWSLAIWMKTGFFPNFTVASLVSIAIIGVSAWILVRHWRALGPPRAANAIDVEAAE